MIKYCPKCEGCFYNNLDIQFCKKHQKEYDEWTNDHYEPENLCECGCSEWIKGSLQMTSPPTFPEAKIYRCKSCATAKLEKSRIGKVRLVIRNDTDPI